MYGAIGKATNGYSCRGRLYKKCCVLWKRQGLGVEHLEEPHERVSVGIKDRKVSHDQARMSRWVWRECVWRGNAGQSYTVEALGGERYSFCCRKQRGSWVGKWFDDGNLFNLGGTLWFTKIVKSRVVLACCLGLYLGSFTLSLTMGNSLYAAVSSAVEKGCN